MHQAVQLALQQIFAVPAGENLSLSDLTSISFASIDEKLPAAWCGFAFDVSTAFAARQCFVEGTDEASHLGVLSFGRFWMVWDIYPVAPREYVCFF